MATKIEDRTNKQVAEKINGRPSEREETPTKVIELKRLQDQELIIPIIGVTPVIPHKWSEKSIRMIREKQQQVGSAAARQQREPKNPEEEADASLYKLPDGRPGMPCVAFKSATVQACRFFEGVTMVQAKSLIFVVGEGPEQLVRIEGERTLREDTPRNQTGVVDLRYRYAFFPWKAVLTIRFPRGLISEGSVIALVDAGGRNGVGDWRPSAPKSLTGTYGQYRINDEEMG